LWPVGRFAEHEKKVWVITMERKWLIREYKEGDEEGIFELWKAVYPDDREYNREKWLRWYRWMYKERPAGEGIIWLAEHNDKIVGQYAIVPVKLKICNKIVLGSLSLDTMTHPDYRRQKMFETLAKRVFDEAAKDGIPIVYCFLNQFTYPCFINKLNWFDIGTMQVMLNPLNWENAVKLKIKKKILQRVLSVGASLIFNKVFLKPQKPPVVEGLTIKQATSFDERFDEFWNTIFNQHQIMVVRDKSYINWRYSMPNANYSIFIAEKANEICGYVALEHEIQKGTKLCFIFDLMAQSEEIMHCLVSRAVEDCRQNKVDLILYPLIANRAYHRVLKRNGFLSSPLEKPRHFCAYSNSPSISKELLRDPRNWIVQLGDVD
jgi:RimJ/RimL family protein N-acetyltransferase